MQVLGLTGGVGMGKSTAAELLRQRDVPVVDTDVIARQLVEAGQPALAAIQRLFGPELVDANGQLRRAELARRIFADRDQRKQLEAILHPRIRKIWLTQVEQWRAEGRLGCVVVVPLLFESGAESHCDATVCVACSSTTQQKRLLARGWNVEQIAQRIQAQWPIEKKMGLADYVVWTEGDLDPHAQQLARILTPELVRTNKLLNGQGERVAE